MACDVLSIPISIVAFESTFSMVGWVLDQFQSSFKPKKVESIVCSDWIFGQEGYIFFSILYEYNIFMIYFELWLFANLRLNFVYFFGL